MLVTPSGIVILVRFEQLENADFPILVTQSGIVIFVRFEHHENAPFPIEVTLSGIIILFFVAGQRISSVLSLLYKTPSIEQ